MASHTDRADVGAALIQRLGAAGAIVCPALNFFAPEPEPVPVPAEGPAGTAAGAAALQERRVVARSPIRRGELLLSLPPGTYLAPPVRGDAAAAGSQLYRGCPRQVARVLEQTTCSGQPLTAFAATTLHMCHLSATKRGPQWFDSYFSLLPAPVNNDDLHPAGDYPCPPCWSSEQLALLEGTTVDRSVVKRVERTRLGLEPCRRSDRDEGPQVEYRSGSYHSPSLREFWIRHVKPLQLAHPEDFPAEVTPGYTNCN